LVQVQLSLAQCGGFEYQYEGDEVPNDYGNAMGYRIDGKLNTENVSKEVVRTKVFTKNKNYSLFIYRHSSASILFEIIDSDSKVVKRITVDDKRKNIFFTVPKVGIYQMKFSFIGDCKYCSCGYAVLSEQDNEKE
jgi:hypothetical protein